MARSSSALAVDIALRALQVGYCFVQFRLGGTDVGLDAGGDDKNLVTGDKIKITQSAVVLEKLIGQFLFGKASEGVDKK